MINFYNDINFSEKSWFWLFLIIPLSLTWYILKLKKNEGDFNYSSIRLFENIKPSLKIKFRHSLITLRLIAFVLIILALARPQSRSSWQNKSTEGIDIIISMDVSLSMLAKDFKPNRIEVAKEVILDFIDARPNDRIGLIVFGGQAFTQCPLTSDHIVLKNMFPKINAGILDQGTAIGLGLATAVSRIKESKAKSKVIIFISDGVNNVGEISPINAGELAKIYGIKVYCIGVGTRGKALQPVAMYAQGEYQYDYVDVEIDEDVMKKISNLSGGKYFRATNKNSLIEIYQEIDVLEKSIINEKNFSNKEDHFLPFLILAALLLFLEFILRFSLFKTIP